MYEYIKGKKIECEEHMLSASEIASMYGILTENKQPHSLMIAAILREYVRKTNLNIAEYYYPHSKGCMRVYPELLWKPAMSEFAYYNDLDVDNNQQAKVYKIDFEKKKFTYVQENKKQLNKIVSIEKRRQYNGIRN